MLDGNSVSIQPLKNHIARKEYLEMVKENFLPDLQQYRKKRIPIGILSISQAILLGALYVGGYFYYVLNYSYYYFTLILMAGTIFWLILGPIRHIFLIRFYTYLTIFQEHYLHQLNHSELPMELSDKNRFKITRKYPGFKIWQKQFYTAKQQGYIRFMYSNSKKYRQIRVWDRIILIFIGILILIQISLGLYAYFDYPYDAGVDYLLMGLIGIPFLLYPFLYFLEREIGVREQLYLIPLGANIRKFTGKGLVTTKRWKKIIEKHQKLQIQYPNGTNLPQKQEIPINRT